MKKFNLKKLNKNQICTIISAVLFLIGAIFMLVYTFGDQDWAIWTGLILAVLATGIYILVVVEQRKAVSKNLTETKQTKAETPTVDDPTTKGSATDKA